MTGREVDTQETVLERVRCGSELNMKNDSHILEVGLQQRRKLNDGKSAVELLFLSFLNTFYKMNLPHSFWHLLFNRCQLANKVKDTFFKQYPRYY